MSGKSKIEWTDATWNPLRGCTKVSEGCRNCYAMHVAARFSGPGQPYEGLATRGPARWTGEVRLIEKHLTDPLRWRKPRMVFVNSMSDLFHPAVPDEWIDRIFAVMALSPRHTFQILTKRPERMQKYLTRWPDGAGRRVYVWAAAERMRPDTDHAPRPDGWPLPNVWLGTSVEDQATADERIPLLLATPAAVRFVSYEPALGPVSFRRFLWPVHGSWKRPHRSEAEADAAGEIVAWNPQCLVSAHAVFLDQIIVGGESGPGHRPLDVAWVRAVLRDVERAASPAYRCAVFVKQDSGSKPGKQGRIPDELWIKEFPEVPA